MRRVVLDLGALHIGELSPTHLDDRVRLDLIQPEALCQVWKEISWKQSLKNFRKE